MYVFEPKRNQAYAGLHNAFCMIPGIALTKSVVMNVPPSSTSKTRPKQITGKLFQAYIHSICKELCYLSCHTLRIPIEKACSPLQCVNFASVLFLNCMCSSQQTHFRRLWHRRNILSCWASRRKYQHIQCKSGREGYSLEVRPLLSSARYLGHTQGCWRVVGRGQHFGEWEQNRGFWRQ